MGKGTDRRAFAHSKERKNAMKQAQYSFSTGALFPYESEDALQMIRNAGFDYAELMPQAISDASEAATRKFEKTGIRLASIHYPLVMFGVLYTAHRTMREDGRQFSRDLLTMGQRMGCRVLVVHPHNPSYPGYEELLERPVIDNLLWLADECGKRNILMAMENSPYTCSTAEKLAAYVKELGHPNIRPMVDTTEAREADQDPAAFIRACPPCHLHMSDYLGSIKHLPAGEGDTDWADVRDALGDYQGFYTLEPAYKFYLSDTQEKIRKGYEFLCEHFA